MREKITKFIKILILPLLPSHPLLLSLASFSTVMYFFQSSYKCVSALTSGIPWMNFPWNIKNSSDCMHTKSNNKCVSNICSSYMKIKIEKDV